MPTALRGPSRSRQAIPLPTLVATLALTLALAAALWPGRATAADRVWRFTHALPAPWAGAPSAGADLAGATLALQGGALHGPTPLRCDSVTAQPLALPAEGLFEGRLAALPDPAAAARALGLPVLPAPALRLVCANGGFDLVQVDATTWWLALDQRVWALSTAPGTGAPAASPAGVVQRLLERHLGAPARGFTVRTMAALRPFTTAALQTAALAWLALPENPDEAPAIGGDPFTDCQEPVLHFAVGTAAVHGDRADLPVQMADEARRWTLQYRLQHAADGWRVDDVVLRDGTPLRTLLQEAQR